MTDRDEETGKRFFEVTEIVKISPPTATGVSGGTWYQYTIGTGDSAIRGKREGTLDSVKKHAKEFAVNLNERASLGHSAYATRRQQKT